MSKRDRWSKLLEIVKEDDELITRDSHRGTENKLHYWNRYIEITTTAMAGKPQWRGGLTYVDLFAGPGVGVIQNDNLRIPGSPILAANAPKPFSNIILCEKDKVTADACQKRILKFVEPDQFEMIHGDCNNKIAEIAALIPREALTLAFIDPPGLDIHFETVAKLSHCGRVDLLILFADAMDVVRNYVSTYMNQSDSKLDRFLGSDCDWRKKWGALGNVEGSEIRKFFTTLYEKQLAAKLGYIKFGEKTIRFQRRPLYKLIYASKHKRGLDFWDKISRKDAQGQRDLPFG